MTLNGDLAACGGAGRSFRYYNGSALVVSRVYPQAGPRHGGTRVTVHGRGFAELGGALEGDGLRCRFGEGMPLVMGILERNGAYNGTDDALAANATRLVCDSPALPEGAPQGAQPARVQVTNNGDAAALGPSEVFFTFFEAAGGAYYEGSAAERAAAAGGNPETFEA